MPNTLTLPFLLIYLDFSFVDFAKIVTSQQNGVVKTPCPLVDIFYFSVIFTI